MAKFKKRGNAILDSATILILITIFSIVSIFGYYIFDLLNDEVQSSSEISDEAKEVSNSLYLKYPGLVDSLAVLIFVLLIVFVIVSVFLLDTHPIFFIISVVILISVFISSMLISNVYDDIMTDDEIASYANEMTYMSWIMRHIVKLIMVIGFIMLIALFIKFKVA